MEDMEDLRKDVDKMYTDMYLGDGQKNLPMTTRLSMAEDKIDRMSSNLNKALWLAATTLLGLIGEIIRGVVK